MENTDISVISKIFELIEKKHITQKELSDMTGISTSAISDWKHKGSMPSAANVQKICAALNVSPENLLGKHGDADKMSYVINKNDELYGFIELYQNTEESERKRILAYAIAMMNTSIKDGE